MTLRSVFSLIDLFGFSLDLNPKKSGVSPLHAEHKDIFPVIVKDE